MHGKQGGQTVQSTLDITKLMKVAPTIQDSETDSSHSKSSKFNEEVKVVVETVDNTDQMVPRSPPLSKKMKLTWKSLREIQLEKEKEGQVENIT